MTSTMTPTGKTNPDCTSRHHTGTNESWKRGCRCIAAIEAHEKWKANNRGRLRRVPAALAADGTCVAARHNSNLAYLTAGCRCPEAISRNDRNRAAKSAASARARASGMQAEQRRAERAVARLTGGRLTRDPRRPWRSERWRVDTINLAHLMAGGYRIPATHGERVAAVALLLRSGSETTGPFGTWEIAQRMGIDPDSVSRYRREIRQIRERRTARRLADAQWRSACKAAAAERRG